MRKYTLNKAGKTSQTWNMPWANVRAVDVYRKKTRQTRSAFGKWLIGKYFTGEMVVNEAELKSTEHYEGTRRHNFSISETPEYFDNFYAYCDKHDVAASRLMNVLVNTFVSNGCKLNGKAATKVVTGATEKASPTLNSIYSPSFFNDERSGKLSVWIAARIKDGTPMTWSDEVAIKMILSN